MKRKSIEADHEKRIKEISGRIDELYGNSRGKMQVKLFSHPDL
jgi:hypothetical protein